MPGEEPFSGFDGCQHVVRRLVDQCLQRPPNFCAVTGDLLAVLLVPPGHPLLVGEVVLVTQFLQELAHAWVDRAHEGLEVLSPGSPRLQLPGKVLGLQVLLRQVRSSTFSPSVATSAVPLSSAFDSLNSFFQRLHGLGCMVIQLLQFLCSLANLVCSEFDLRPLRLELLLRAHGYIGHRDPLCLKRLLRLLLHLLEVEILLRRFPLDHILELFHGLV